MPELTQRMIDAGAVGFDGNGIPMRADGTPALVENQPEPEPVSDGGAGILAHIAATQGLTGGEMPGGGPVTDQNTLGFSFNPLYSPSQQKYPENKAPLDPEWQWGEGEPGSWEQFYTPEDRSTGGGFFLAKDNFGDMGVPEAYQQGASSPSTNNWRLIGNDPRFIMRNGYIIDRYATDLKGPPVPDIGFGNNYGGPFWNSQAGEVSGFPAAYNRGYTSFAGWPGTNNWANTGTYWGG